MLNHLGLLETSAMIENALLYTLESGIHTGDFGDKNIASLSTTEFASAIINNFGKIPVKNPKAILPNHYNAPSFVKPDKNPMLLGANQSEISIVGVDLFVEFSGQPSEIGDLCLSILGDNSKLKLITISNRGTQVWPSGSIFTNLVNQYRCRFESINDVPLSQEDTLELTSKIAKTFKVCSYEILNMWENKKAYSLAQGQ
jgi:isocitrate dehydrogenase